MKIRVKILESIAGLADVDTGKLDAKYAKFKSEARARRPKPMAEPVIEDRIAEMKLADRYAHKPLGFVRDWAFKIGDEPMVDSALAGKWEDAGICQIVRDEKKATA